MLLANSVQVLSQQIACNVQGLLNFFSTANAWLNVATDIMPTLITKYASLVQGSWGAKNALMMQSIQFLYAKSVNTP